MSFWDRAAETLGEWSVGGGAVEVVRASVAAAAIYLVALWITRTGKKRFFGRNTVFDLVLALILGSVLSRAINGDASFHGTVAAGVVLVLMHWVFGVIAVRTEDFGPMIKGRGETVVEDGEVLEDKLHDHHLTHNDLEEAVRQSGLSSLEDVKLATFERDGSISVVPKTRVHVVEVDVRDGVQTVRIEMQT